MIGKPKYKIGQIVSFEVDMRNRSTQEVVTETKEGLIVVVDTYGTFEDNTDVSYDVFVSDENCIYKHVREDFIIK